MGLHAFAMSRFSGVWSGHEDDPGGGRILGLGRRRPGSREDRAARGLRHAARRPAHPLARPAARAGGAADGLQVVRRAGLCAGQQVEPQRGRVQPRPPGHHRQRQGLQRHAPGAGRPGPGRRHLPHAGHPAAQGQRGLAARGDDHARFRAGSAGDPGRRRKAPGHRIPDQGTALQLARRRAAQRVGQVRRARRCGRRRVEHAQPERELAAAGQGRPDAGHRRQGHRQAAGQARPGAGRQRRRGAHGPAHRGDRRPRTRDGRAQDRHRRARAVVLLGLPAQHQHPRARGLARDGRHRLPLHVGLDGPQHQHVLADGRRRCGLGRPASVHHRRACLRQPRRRHLLPQRLAGHPPEHRRRREHHLQGALQRRRGDDRRPAGR